jgi:N-acetylglucosamine-6-phosphate deacetylase
VAFDGEIVVDRGTGDAPAGAVDLGATVLAPGYVDLQVNGLGRVDLATAGPEQIVELATVLVERGVTAFCPTITSRAPGDYEPWLERVAEARRPEGNGATPAAAILGAHLEGPFLGGAPGAHDPALIRAVDLEWTVQLLDEHPGEIAMVTLAPEADPRGELTRMLVARGVSVALGHSHATFEQAAAAADAGATVVTHLFNGMGSLHHREPGLAGAALTDPRLTPTIIADCVHVHPAVLSAVFAAKPGVAIVSDTVATHPGADTAGVREVDGAARLPDGTLAGSIVPLDRGVANVVALGVPLRRAVAMATEIPARLIGCHDRGRLAAGARADLVALDPRDASVRAVWFGGRAVGR